MARCRIHKNKEAVARCVICGKPFCSLCLEKVGEKHMCFKCLKKVAKREEKRTRAVPYKALNLSLLISIAAYSFIIIYILFLSLPLVPDTLGDLTSFEAKDFMMLVAKIILIGIEIILIYITISFAFTLGFMISIGLILSLFLKTPSPILTNEIILFYIVIPIIALFGLVAGRKGLQGRKK